MLGQEFLQKCLKESNISDTIKTISVLSEENNYDSYEIETVEQRVFRVKISFDSKNYDLKRELDVLHKTQGIATGKPFSFKESKNTYLVFQFPQSINVLELPKSELIEDRNNLFRAYFTLNGAISPNPKRKYKSIIKEHTKNLSLKNFPKDSVDAIKDYSDYDILNKFLTKLSTEIQDRVSKIDASKTCLGGMPMKNIFYSNGLYFFDYLHRTSLCHPFIDLVDFILDFGADNKTETLFLDEFCKVGNLDKDRHLYNEIYQLQLRQKLLDMVSQYLLEVYVLRSQRITNLVDLANLFAQSLDRFRCIPVFLDNNSFLLKTITEPILGVKA
tara:strand:+ start:4842 stop:5831 length:990 start_codon:yes stop_codon:yes gene_type:complete